MKRKHKTTDLNAGAGPLYTYPSEYIEQIEGGERGAEEALRSNRHQAIERDRNFRDRHVRFDIAEWLQDLKSTDTDEEGIPAHNDIRKITEDLLSVILPNMPTAKLEAGEYVIDPRAPQEERHYQIQFARETETTRNKMVERVKKRNAYTGERIDIAYDAVINGVGYSHPWLEEVPNRRRQPELDHLLSKDYWTWDDLSQLEGLSLEPTTGHVESNEVFWRSGVRSVEDEDMTRVSRARVRDVQWLRDHYHDGGIKAGKEVRDPDIHSGLWLNPDEREDVEHNQAGFVETWQIEEFIIQPRKRFFMGAGDAGSVTWNADVEDAQLVYTAITTNRLLDYRIYTSDEVPIELPFIPFYIKQSKDHPYGFSVPLMLQLQQMFVNRLRALLMKQQMNAVAPQSVAVMVDKLGGGDREQIERAFRDGGVAWITGGDGVVDVREMIQPTQYASSAANPAIVQMLNSEKAAMDEAGQVMPTRELGRARSASGKYAMMNAADRPKGYSVLLLGESEKRHTERIDSLNQKAIGRKTVTIPVGLGASEGAVLNEKVKKRIVQVDYEGRPVYSDLFKSPTNKQGLVTEDKEFVRNDMMIPLHASASNQGNWPTDIMARLELAAALSNSEMLLSNKTARELVLDERTRNLDDMNAMKEAEGREGNDRLMQMLQQAEQPQRMISQGPGEAMRQLPQNQVGQNRNTPTQEVAQQRMGG